VLAYLKGSFGLPLSRVFSYLGKISYSMYAWHTIVCMIVVQYLAAPFDEPYLIGLIVVLPSTIALSAISHYLIASPFLALRMRYVRLSASSGENGVSARAAQSVSPLV
jgi:peptidoglycan/LPS O-acetylase OafA/YrhL